MRLTLVTTILCLFSMSAASDATQLHVIDDLGDQSREPWRLVTDGVMGGVSSGHLEFTQVDGRDCLRLQGEVSLENNGGFVQMARDWSADQSEKVDTYTGLLLDVYGNGEAYNVHLRTRGLWLPWQAYRATFKTDAQWTTIRLPFAEFAPYKTRQSLAVNKIKRIGVVAIGRPFTADVCVARIALYR